MKTQRPEIPTRADAWKNAAWYALIVATVLLVVVKMFTPVVFGAALAVAIFVFLTTFGFILRITPKSEP